MQDPFSADDVKQLIRLAIREDLGTGDVTTESVVAKDATACAKIVAREAGVVAGLPIVEPVLREFGSKARIEFRAGDGDRVAPGQVLAVIEGAAREVLAVERTALNFLQRLSGIATLTRKFVDAIAGTNAHILDTRKTTPGWRLLEKYAVRAGGGQNHRMGLYDEALVKDNHLVALRAGGESLKDALAKLRAKHPGLFIEVEAENESDVREAVEAGADAVLLDNMTPAQLARMVKLAGSLTPKKRPLLEASGGVTLSTVRAVAESGVDRISVGALTHSAPALDIAMDFDK